MSKIIERFVERGIFASRWLLAPLYVGLIIAQTFYCYRFGVELWHLIHNAITGVLHDPVTGVVKTVQVAGGALPETFSAALCLLGVLELIDMVMVANLIIIVLIGGYATFVSKLDLDDHVDRPAWLDHIDPGTLKTKLAGGLVGVSGIHVLQSFVKLSEASKVANFDYQPIMWQVIIHGTFTIAVLIMAYADLIVERKLKMGHGEGMAEDTKEKISPTTPAAATH